MTRKEFDELAHTDPYFVFRDGIPNPSDEVCTCSGKPAVLLVARLSRNPFACIDCNLDVLPEDVPLPRELIGTIGSWHSMADAFEKLWLESGAYEEMAARELRDPKSPVNVSGMEAARELSSVRDAYYWWFEEHEREDWKPFKTCPVCHGELTSRGSERMPRLVCDSCRVVVSADSE